MAITSGGEVLMQLFRSEGVEYIFGLPGLTEVRFIDVLEDHPEIKYVMGLHQPSHHILTGCIVPVISEQQHFVLVILWFMIVVTLLFSTTLQFLL
jgi:hypothetical protein